MVDTARRIEKFQSRVNKQKDAADSRKGKKAQRAAAKASETPVEEEKPVVETPVVEEKPVVETPSSFLAIASAALISKYLESLPFLQALLKPFHVKFVVALL